MKISSDLNKVMKTGKKLLCANYEYDFDNNYAHPGKDYLKIVLRVGVALLVIWMLGFGLLLARGCDVAHAYTDEEAIKAVIGEAENQGYNGMLAVAGAIRNRGSLKGCYGFQAPRVLHHKYSEITYYTAQKAWEKSKYLDITHGANHWENINAFGTPCWVKHCVETFRYRDHVFYKENT